MALNTVLACMAALTVVLFTAVSAAVSHLNFARAASAESHAKNLADAAISQTIDRLIDSNFELGSEGEGEIRYLIPGLDDAEGSLSFSGAGAFDGRQSTNNLQSDDQLLGGFGREVPGRTVHLVARGRVGNTVRWVECLYHRPPFPDGLISSGPVDAKALQLLAVRRQANYAGGDPSTIAPEDRAPSNLFSNSPRGFQVGEPSVKVADNSRIEGSVGSVGSVNVDGSTVVEGEVLPASNERDIPELDILEKMALLTPNAIDVSSPSGDFSLDPNWFSKSDGNFSVGGDLDLSGSVLLVNGNLQVGGAVTGTGIILVNGNVEIDDGGNSVSSSDQVAIACTGDFTLKAATPEGNYFQGLVYCEGDFEAKDITVFGSTVVHGKNGADGSASLDNVRFIQSPGSVNLILTRHRGVYLPDNGGNLIDLSLTLRENQEGEYVIDARGYFTDNKDERDKPDTPLDWDKSPGGRDTYKEKHFPNIPVSSLNEDAIKESLRQALEPDFEAWYEIRDGDKAWQNNAKQRFEEFLDKLAESLTEGDEYTVTFNLNNLLSDPAESSRLLYWRPVKLN